jgi:phosphohistidine phosphatase SixA
MKVVLIRHASRVRDAEPAKDPVLPLSSAGISECRELARQLAEAKLKPDLYLTSRYEHAHQTGEQLEGQLRDSVAIPVVGLSTLTPHHSFTLETIFAEAQKLGYDPRHASVIVVVLHHPRFQQLAALMTSQPETGKIPAHAEAVCLAADSFDDFARGKAEESFRIGANRP